MTQSTPSQISPTTAHSPSPLAHWTLERVAATTGGALEARFGARPLTAITSDSRTLCAGDYFLALRGEKFDGHRFCEAAARAGAAGLIIDEAFSTSTDGSALRSAHPGLPLLVVVDTLRAYGELAAARRREWGNSTAAASANGTRKALAISGSAGKTTTRRLVAEAIGRHHRVLEPERNYNNLIGVPQTLLRLEDHGSSAHEIAVLELGMNQPGELRRLTEIAQPDAALLTQIGLAHIGMFDSVMDLVNAKLDLFRGCAPGVPLVINAACPRTMMAIEPFTANHPITTFTGDAAPLFGTEPKVRIENVRPLDPIGYAFDLALPNETLRDLQLAMFGRHHLANVAAAAALLLAAGLNPGWVAEALPDFHTEPLRGERIEADGFSLIVDCYNASPPSMVSALESLGETPARGRKIIVMADMLELGAQADMAHEMLLVTLRTLPPSLFFGLGPQTSHLAHTLADENWTAKGFDDRDALTEALRAAAHPGDLIFFKGSHSYCLEHVAAALAPSAHIAH